MEKVTAQQAGFWIPGCGHPFPALSDPFEGTLQQIFGGVMFADEQERYPRKPGKPGLRESRNPSSSSTGNCTSPGMHWLELSAGV